MIDVEQPDWYEKVCAVFRGGHETWEFRRVGPRLFLVKTVEWNGGKPK